METRRCRTVEQSRLDARRRIRSHRGVLVGARGDGGRRPWRRAGRRDAHRLVSAGCVAPVDPLRGTSWSASSSRVVLFVPVGRYSLAINLPFGLEFWQLAVALVVLVWLASLLVDPRVRLRRTPLDAPVALIVAASLGSVAVNYGRVAPLASAVLKARHRLPFLHHPLLLHLQCRHDRRRRCRGHAVHRVWRRRRRVLRDHRAEDGVQHLRSCSERPPISAIRRGEHSRIRYGLIRAIGSADHPIALGVLFAMVVPARTSSREVAIARLVGAYVTDSHRRTRDGVSYACSWRWSTAAVAFLWLRPRDILPLSASGDPMVIVIKIVAPGSIATLKNSFLPSSGPGLIASQRTLAADPTLISGRANFKPRLIEGMRRPILGQGLGTRQTGEDNPLRNAPILDNQWLGLFLDIGLLGVAGWIWLIVRIVRRLGRIARTRGSPEGLLAAGFVASIIGLRRRDAHVRLARVRPGGGHSLGASGARCDADRSAPGDSSFLVGAGSLTRALGPTRASTRRREYRELDRRWQRRRPRFTRVSAVARMKDSAGDLLPRDRRPARMSSTPGRTVDCFHGSGRRQARRISFDDGNASDLDIGLASVARAVTRRRVVLRGGRSDRISRQPRRGRSTRAQSARHDDRHARDGSSSLAKASAGGRERES